MRKADKHTKNKTKFKTNPFDSVLFEFAKRVSKKWDKDECKKLSTKVCPSGVTVIKDIPYIDDAKKSHMLDILYKNDLDEAAPIMIDIHGGGFISGSKESDNLFNHYFALAGFVVFSINYTLIVDEVDVFYNIAEVHSATKWVLENATKYHGDLSNIYFSGHSAGGVLAIVELLLSKDKNLCSIYGFEMLDFSAKGLILDCGFMKFYDKILPYAMFRNVVFPAGYEKDDRYKNIIFEKNPNIKLLPKTFLITNDKDELRNMSIYFYKLLQKNNVESKLEKAKTGGHVGIIYEPETEENQKIFKSIFEFFDLK